MIPGSGPGVAHDPMRSAAITDMWWCAWTALAFNPVTAASLQPLAYRSSGPYDRLLETA